METKLITDIDKYLQTYLPDYSKNDRVVQLDDCARFLNEELHPEEVRAKNFHKVTVGEAFREYLEVLTELLDESIRSVLNNACELQKRNCLESLDISCGEDLMEWEDFKEAIMSAPLPSISESNTIPYLKVNEITKEIDNTYWKGDFLCGKVVDFGKGDIRVVVNFDHNEKSEDYKDTVIEFVKDKIDELEDTKYAVYFCYKEDSIDVFIKELRADVALKINDEFNRLFKDVSLEQIVGSPIQSVKNDAGFNHIPELEVLCSKIKPSKTEFIIYQDDAYMSLEDTEKIKKEIREAIIEHLDLCEEDLENSLSPAIADIVKKEIVARTEQGYSDFFYDYCNDTKVCLDNDIGQQIIILNPKITSCSSNAQKYRNLGENLQSIMLMNNGDYGCEYKYNPEDGHIYRHAGGNGYSYTETIVGLKKSFEMDDFEQAAYNLKSQAEWDAVIEKYTEPIGHHIAEIYGWDQVQNQRKHTENTIVIDKKLFVLSQKQKKRLDKGKITKVGTIRHNGKKHAVFAQKRGDGEPKVEYHPIKPKQVRKSANSKLRNI